MFSLKPSLICRFAALYSLSLPAIVLADASRDASTLIRLSNVRELFESTRERQTRSVIRTYASIVRTESGQLLPHRIREQIALCYAERYHWPLFEDGIVNILLTNLSETEIKLLLDFYRNRSVPPTEITAFRGIVAKGELIQSLSAEHIFNTTEGCIEQGTEAVLNFLTTQP